MEFIYYSDLNILIFSVYEKIYNRLFKFIEFLKLMI